MFRFIGSVLGALPIYQDLPLTANEAGVIGTAMKYSSAALTKCTGSDTAVYAVAHESKAASASAQKVGTVLVRPGDRFEADYTGTPDAGFIVGVMKADLASDGLSIDSADITNGSFVVEEIDTTNKKVKGYFAKCGISQ